jgi:hypothetical protein
MSLEREWRDELEVSGHVLAIESLSLSQVRDELNKLMDEFEMLGYKKLDDIPESPKKQRYRDLLKALNFNVGF